MADEPTVGPGWRLDGPVGAPALVLGASLGTTADLWAPLLPTLSRRHRVIRFDLPGHGAPVDALPRPGRLSDLADLVLAGLDRLGVTRFAYAGVSIGGMIGMHLASTAPDRVSSLVVCNSSPDFDRVVWDERIRLVQEQGMDAVADFVVPRFLSERFRAARPDDVASVRATVAAIDPEGYVACSEAIRDMDLRDQLARITAPTLVIAGGEDPATPPDRSLEIVSRVPGARLEVVAGAAHLACLHEPELVADAIVAHVRGDGGAYERGLAVRRSVLGATYVDAAVAGASAFRAPFDDVVTQSAWGLVWTRDGLDRRTRSCVTMAMLTALGRFDELALHVVAARRNGVTVAEIQEVLLQTAVYCGAPAARSAFAVAESALADKSTDESTDELTDG
jgi:3-oxoadipate enol-lactonase/4-carboxymuconolactone decarboxylase